MTLINRDYLYQKGLPKPFIFRSIMHQSSDNLNLFSKAVLIRNLKSKFYWLYSVEWSQRLAMRLRRFFRFFRYCWLFWFFRLVDSVFSVDWSIWSILSIWLFLWFQSIWSIWSILLKCVLSNQSLTDFCHDFAAK